MSHKGGYKIPFDKNGDQLHYASERWSSDVVWMANIEFDDELQYAGIMRGQSAAYFRFRSLRNGKHYTMFMKDAGDIFERGTVASGRISGRWTFVKRGENYGVRLAD